MKESEKVYIPKLNEIDMEVVNLVGRSGHDTLIQDRLNLLAGTTSNSRFEVVPSKDYGGSVSIKIPGRVEPVLRISVGQSSHILMGSSKSSENITYWELEAGEIEGNGDLGEAVKKIILGNTTKKVEAPLYKDIKIKKAE